MTVHIWFPIDIYSNYMPISHCLALIATQNVFAYLLSLDPIMKIANAPYDPKMTMNVTRSEVHDICTSSTHACKFHSSLFYDRPFSR